MSGGSLDYGYSKIEMITDLIEEEIAQNGKEDNWGYKVDHSDAMIEAMLDTIWELKKASVYAKRLEWYLSGDDGEDSYFERIKEDMKEVQEQFELYKRKVKQNV